MAAINRLTGAPSANGKDWKAINWQKSRNGGSDQVNILLLLVIMAIFAPF